jgi:hypothetical protein
MGMGQCTTTSRSSFGTCRQRVRIFCTLRCGARRETRTISMATLSERLCRAPFLLSLASGCVSLWGQGVMRHQHLSYLAARVLILLGDARLFSALRLALGRTSSPPAAVVVVLPSSAPVVLLLPTRAATQVAVRMETPRALARREVLMGFSVAATLD